MSAPTRSSCWWPTWRGRDVRPVHEESRQTRLGRGFYETRRLQPEPIARTAEAVWDFAETAREKNAASIRVIATSAARDAVNPTDLTDAIFRASGLKTEIISGAREAEWAFQGRDDRSGTGAASAVAAGRGRRQHGIHRGPRREKTFCAQLSARHGAADGTISAQRPANERRVQRLPRLDEGFSANRSPAAAGTGAAKMTRRNPARRHRRHDEHPGAHREEAGPLRPRENRARPF